MPVDPRLEPLLAQPPVGGDTGTPAERRAAAHAAAVAMAPVIARPPVPVADVRDHLVAVDGGTIAVRVYRPTPDAAAPGLVYIHGGGWWMGSLDLVDTTCRRLAVAGRCVVVSVDYRLAPEHPFPVPLEDSYAALRWTVDHAAELGVDTTRVAVGGESAGANLAAAVTLLARDRGGPRLVAQLLEVPAVDLTLSQPSMQELGAGYSLTKEAITECVAFYAGEADHGDPLVSPLFAALAGLPPALVITCEYDPLRDDGSAYAARLRDAGVEAELVQLPGMLHGTMNLDGVVPDVADALDHTVGTFLRGRWG